MYFQIVFAAILVIWQSQVFGGVVLKDTKGFEICESEDCYNTAKQILKWLNPEANPCEDFYEFTCGNWRNLPIDERVNMTLGSRDSPAKKFIPALLKDPSATNGKKYFEHLRNFMLACMDEDTIKSVGLTPIKQLIQKAGGWPVLGADWSKGNWDFLTAEITLGGVLIDVGTTYYKDENSSVVTNMISLGPSSLINRPTMDVMVDVAVAFGADKENAEKAIIEVMEFESAFEQELRNVQYWERMKITFKNFQEEIVPWLDLTKLVEVYLPKSFKLLPETIIMGQKNYFLVLGKFIKQYPAETFINYMISKAVYPLLDYVHHDLNISSNDIWFAEKNKGKTRFEFCTKVVEESSLGPAMAAYLGSLCTESTKVASEITEVIIKELSKEIEETEWLDEVTRQEVAKNLSEVKTYVGFPPKITDLEELDKLYEGYEIDTSKYFDARIYDRNWIKRRDFDNLHKNITADYKMDLDWRYYMLLGLFVNGFFDPRSNVIAVSGPMLNFLPLFSPGNPAYVNYGEVGTVLAHELIHSVDFKASPLKETEMKKWGSNQTKNNYDQKKQCFIDFYSSFNDTKTTKLKLNGTYTLRENMADNAGLRLSLRAYRKMANQLGRPERKLPGLQQYSIEQLFMISVANFFCEIPNKQKLIEQLSDDRHSPFEFRVKGMMMNSPDFSEIFNCDKNDPMNPPEKCEVW